MISVLLKYLNSFASILASLWDIKIYLIEPRKLDRDYIFYILYSIIKII